MKDDVVSGILTEKVPLYVLDDSGKPGKKVLPDDKGTEVSIDTPVITFDTLVDSIRVPPMAVGDDGILPELPVITRGGYTFKGWYTAAGGGTEITKETVFTEDTTVYARWAINSEASTGGAFTPGYPSYQITVPAVSNGAVTVTPIPARAGATVTVTTKPDNGYTVGSVTVTDRGGENVTVTDSGGGVYTFTMPVSQVTVSVTFSAVRTSWISPFTDVSESHRFYEYVAYVVQNGLMNGEGDGKFNPSGTTTRGMIMTILARLAGVDTGGSDPWYQTGMEWATGADVSDGSAPEANITREQLATMLWRYAGEPAATGDLSAYPDAAGVHADWAGTAMIWAVENGIINGSDGNLNPQDNASRAETAAMLTRFCKNIEK